MTDAGVVTDGNHHCLFDFLTCTEFISRCLEAEFSSSSFPAETCDGQMAGQWGHSLSLLPLQGLPLPLLRGQTAEEFLHPSLSLRVPGRHRSQRGRQVPLCPNGEATGRFPTHLWRTSLSFSLARKLESFLSSLRAPLNSFLYLCFSRSFSRSSLVQPRFFP